MLRHSEFVSGLSLSVMSSKPSSKPKNSTFAPLLQKLSPTTAEKLIGFSVQESILDEYDNLSIDEFKKVLRFLQALYKDACN